MRRYLAVPVLAVLALALAWLPLSARAQNDPASRALRYLSSQQAANGSLPGFSIAQGTEDFALGAAGAGYDPRTLKTGAGTSVYDYLGAPANLAAETTGAGGTGRLVEAVVAGGLDPHAFGGQDLVAKLQLFNGGNGQYAGGASFDQSLALLGLLAAGVTPPANGVAYLKSLQKADGGWEFGAGSGGDSNTTAMAVMALTAAGDTSATAAALSFLHTQQVADGGFTYQTFPGATSDPDSDALGVQAVVAAGQDPAGAAWRFSGQTPYGRLLASQDPATGGFAYLPGTAPDAGTTSEVPAGLELRPFPVRAVHGSGYSLAGSVAAGTKALVYLNHQQAADGSLPGFSVAQGTEDFAIGAAAAGFDPNTLSNCGSTAYTYLAMQVGSITPNAGSTGRLVEAVVAGRLDPTHFGGVNVVARLQSFNSSANGQYAAGAPFSQALALLGLVAAGQSPPANAISYLKGLQLPDGGWEFTSGFGSDSNTTAMALMALDAAGDHSADAGALTSLRSFQAADGGFQYQAGFGSDVDSDALALQALLGADQDPAAVSWAQGTNTVLTHLAASQDADGGFGFQSTTSDPSTTSSVPEGLERLPFPIRPRYTAGTRLPSQPACPTPTPTPTPTASPAPTSTPTPTATPAAAPAPVAEAAATPTTVSSASPPAPSPSTAASPSPSPSAESVPSPSASAALPAAPPSGALPAWLIYSLAALAGLLVVAGGGVALLRFRA